MQNDDVKALFEIYIERFKNDIYERIIKKNEVSERMIIEDEKAIAVFLKYTKSKRKNSAYYVELAYDKAESVFYIVKNKEFYALSYELSHATIIYFNDRGVAISYNAFKSILDIVSNFNEFKTLFCATYSPEYLCKY